MVPAMLNSAEQLLSDIEAFLDRQGMAPSTFGENACEYKNLVKRLRAGKTVTLETADRVRRYMAKVESEAAE